MSLDLRVSRIYRHLAASPSFGGKIAGAGGTPSLSYLAFQTMEMPLDGDNTKILKSTDTGWPVSTESTVTAFKFRAQLDLP